MSFTKRTIILLIIIISTIRGQAQTQDELLADAITFEDYKGARKALKKGANPNAMAEEGTKALIAMAVEIDCMNYFDENDYEEEYNEDVLTVTSIASDEAIPFTKLLLDFGADPNVYNTEDSFDNEWRMIGPIDIAIENDRMDIVKYLVEKGGVQLDSEDREPVIFSALNSYSTEIIPYLASKGVPINVRNSKGYTPLHKAIEIGEPIQIVALLKNGTDPNAIDTIGWTPLVRAIKNEQSSLIGLFEGYPVDFDYKDANGHSIFWMAEEINNRGVLDELAKLSTNYFSQKRNLVIKTAHSATVNGVAFHPDGSQFATGSSDKTIKIWDSRSGREIKTLDRHNNPIWQIHYSPDGSKIISGGADLYEGIIEVCVWDVATGIRLSQFENIDGYYPLLFMPDDQHSIFSAGRGAVYNLNNGNATRIIEQMLVADFSPDGRILAGVVKEKHPVDNYEIEKLKLWDASSDSLLFTFPDEPSRTTDLKFSPDGKYIAGVIYQNVVIWNVETGKIEQQMEQGDYITCLEFSSDGKFLVSGATGGSIAFWDTSDWSEIKTIDSHEDDVYDIALSPDNQYLVSVGKDEKAHFWEVFEDKPLYTLATEAGSVSFARFHPIENLIFSGGTRLTFSTESDFAKNRIKVWNITNGQLAGYWNHNGGAKFLSFTPDGKNIFTGFDKNIIQWDFESTEKVNQFETTHGEIYDLKVSLDGNILAAGDIGGNVTFWNLQNPSASGSYISDPTGGTFIDISTDSKLIASGGTNDAIHIYDIGSHMEVNQFPTGHEFVESISFNKENTEVVVSGYDKKVIGWNTSTGQETKSFQTDALMIQVDDHTNKRFSLSGDDFEVVVSSDISPDGKKLVYGSRDQNAYLWDYEGGFLINILEGHQNVVTDVGFSPKGSMVLTGSYDGSMKLWDSQTGDLIVTFVALEGENQDFVIYAPDGYFMSSRSGASAVHFTEGKNIFLFDQFDLKYNRPDIILKRIGYATSGLIDTYEKAYEKRLTKMGFTEGMLSDELNAPEVEFQTELPRIVETEKVTMAIHAKDENQNLDRLNIYVNGVPEFGQKGQPLNEAEVSRQFEITLSPGLNVIEAEVYNEGGVRSINSKIEVTYEGQETKPDLYIVSIGVSKFNQEAFNLEYAAKDADDFASLIESNQKNYRNITKKVLLNKEATAENILQIKDMLDNSSVNDQVMVFVASHGLLDVNLDYYIATSDIDFNNPADRGLPYSSLESLLDHIPARKKLMFIDACHSGEVDKEAEEPAFSPVASIPSNGNVTFRGFQSNENKLSLQSSFELMKSLFVDLRRGTGAIVISSASGAEYAFESEEFKNGIFTYSLINALKNADADQNSDGEIQVSELSSYVFNKVGELTGGKQTPTFRRENLEFDYPVW
ncbi:MAG: caspase family protein [Bacteroidetes bacterium]|nr:caspase family protein [Bacteroidota bacterium]